MGKSEYKFIFTSFLIWKIGLYLTIFLSLNFWRIQTNFLGGGLSNFLTNPYFWAFGNFDGQHYINIAQNGYGYGEHAFFPLYPILISFIGQLFGKSLFLLNLWGQLVSNTALIFALFGVYKLTKLDFNSKVARTSVLLMLTFPTAFYFNAVYTESLFLCLSVWSFYFFKTKKYWPASVLGMLLASTRLVGVFIFLAFIAEWLVNEKLKMGKQKTNTQLPNAQDVLENLPPVGFTFIPLGLLSYMFYLKITTGEMLTFFREASLYGEQRSKNLIMLPQVFYRYIFKILPSLKTSYFPVLFSTYLEFLLSLAFILPIVKLFKSRQTAYAIFSLFAYFTPTLSGSFSSMPRYLLVIFPVFILVAGFMENKKKVLFVLYGFSIILQLISLSLFATGHWIS